MCCSPIELPVEFCSMMYKWCYLTASAAAVSTAAVCFLLWFRFRSVGRTDGRRSVGRSVVFCSCCFLAWSERASARALIFDCVYMGIKCAALAA